MDWCCRVGWTCRLCNYGEEPLRPEWAGDAARDRYEMELIHLCLQADKPVLGVCRGAQVLNVALGGSLYQDIATQHQAGHVHRNWDIYDQHGHDVMVEPGTALARWYNCSATGARARTNSVHHQGVKQLGRDLVVEARSVPDRSPPWRSTCATHAVDGPEMVLMAMRDARADCEIARATFRTCRPRCRDAASALPAKRTSIQPSRTSRSSKAPLPPCTMAGPPTKRMRFPSCRAAFHAGPPTRSAMRRALGRSPDTPDPMKRNPRWSWSRTGAEPAYPGLPDHHPVSATHAVHGSAPPPGS